MKQYNEYKDSGVKWIGEMPEHWKLTRIKFLFNEISEKEHPEGPCLCSTQKYGVIPQSMYENRVVVVNKGLENLKFVRKGNFVISLRSFQGGIEIAHYQGIISAAYTILSLGSKNISSNYIKYLFKSSPFIQLLQICVTGIREGQNINYELLRRQFIPIPTLSEQNEIVAYLDNKVSKIDKYISTAEKKMAALEELKQVTIADAVTHGINPNVPMKDSGIPWIGMVPEHWEVKRAAIMFSENKNKNSKYEFSHAFKFNYGTLVPKDETGDVSEYRDTYEAYTIIKKNDIAINCLNLNYDFVSQRVAISPNRGILTSAYLIITPRNGVNPYYYNYLFKAMDSKKLFHGMGTGIRLTLSYTELKKQFLPNPSFTEQDEIVAYIDRKVAQIDKMKVLELAQIDKLKEYKQRLISDVVTGKVKVTNE